MDGDVPGGYETGPARETDLDGVVGLLEAAAEREGAGFWFIDAATALDRIKAERDR